MENRHSRRDFSDSRTGEYGFAAEARARSASPVARLWHALPHPVPDRRVRPGRALLPPSTDVDHRLHEKIRLGRHKARNGLIALPEFDLSRTRAAEISPTGVRERAAPLSPARNDSKNVHLHRRRNAERLSGWRGPGLASVRRTPPRRRGLQERQFAPRSRMTRA